jgi:hypothetical protein
MPSKNMTCSPTILEFFSQKHDFFSQKHDFPSPQNINLPPKKDALKFKFVFIDGYFGYISNLT